MISGNYKVSKSSVFISKTHIKREVFCAKFRDRVVHHLMHFYINDFFERSFIYDSYSCRVGKGTLFGIKRISKFIKSCSENYKKETWVLQLDITGYFMHINKKTLFSYIKKFLEKRFLNENFIKKFSEQKINFYYKNFFSESVEVDISSKISASSEIPAKAGIHSEEKIFSKEVFLKNKIKRQKILNFLLKILEKIIFNEAKNNCDFKSPKEDWKDLPKSKSLFGSPEFCGLPIGNLSSQLFSNIYLDKLDKFIKNKLGFQYYGRYVDDMVLIHNSKTELENAIPKIKEFLKEKLHLEISDKKTKLNKVENGIDFLGAIIKPHRIYVRNRTKGNFYKKIFKFNKQEENFQKNLQKIFSSTEGFSPLQKKDFKIFSQKNNTSNTKILNRQKQHKEFLKKVEFSVNSYLGIMKHFDSYKLRTKILNQISPKLRKFFRFYSKNKIKLLKNNSRKK